MSEYLEIYTESFDAGRERVLLVTSADNESEETSDKKWVLCRNCALRIAETEKRISVNQTETHIFKNPSGIIFRVVCFSDAPGAAEVTGYTGENTWFSGYLWAITVCRGCGSHLGWHYSSGTLSFYGLIADRLAGI